MKKALLLFAMVGFSVLLTAQDCPETENKKAKKLYDEALSKYKSRVTYKELLEEAEKIDPDNAVVLDSLARFHWDRKAGNFMLPKIKKAVNYFNRVIDLCPELDPLAYYVSGRMDRENKKYNDAATKFKKFLSYEKNDAYKLNDYDLDSAEYFLGLVEFKAEAYKNPVPFNPVQVPNVSTPDMEYLGCLTPDGEYFYFTRRMTVKEGIMGFEREAEIFTVAQLQPDGTFNKGKPMPSPFNKGGFNQGALTTTIDNKILYLTICTDPSFAGSCDIHYSIYNAGEWGPLTNLGPNINSPDTWESQPSISSDGRTLYFVSDRPGGQGMLDIYTSVKKDDGTWGRAQNLGKPINTQLNDRSPFFHTDGQTLYFSSQGHQNLGESEPPYTYDIFLAKLDSMGKFKNPKNIGYPINTEEDDYGLFVSTDGKKAYLASNRLKEIEKEDFFSFDLYKEARPEKVLFIKGQIKDDKGTPVTSGTVEFKNLDTKEVVKFNIDSTSGKFVAAVAQTGDIVMKVKSPDMAFTAQLIAKTDTTPKPRKMEIEVKPVAIGKAYTINNIKFATNSFELNKSSKFIISEFAEYLGDNPAIKVAINGHTDDVGNDAENLKLSDNRAKAVYEYLISLGIKADRLTYKGFGETKPLVPNKTDADRAKNRRTEFVITAK